MQRRHVADLDPLDISYLHWWMLTPEFTACATGEQGRSVLPKINQRDLSKLPVPVPPLPEQRRIVAAVEEHFSRLDAAEDDLRARAPRTTVLLQASLIASIPCKDVPSDWTLATSTRPVGQTSGGSGRRSITMDRPCARTSESRMSFEDRLDLLGRDGDGLR